MYKDLDIKDKNHISYVEMKLKDMLGVNIEHYLKSNPNMDYVKHIILHRQAFAKIEHRSKYHGMFSNEHDIDKVGLGLILGKDETKRIHKTLAPHHNVDWDNNDIHIVEKVIDWESCHYTKLGKNKTAYEYLMENHADKVDIMRPILQELGIWEEQNVVTLTKEHYEQMESSLDIETIVSEIKKSYNYLSNLV